MASRNPLKFSSQLTLRKKHLIFSKEPGQNDKLTGTSELYIQIGTVPVKPGHIVR